MVAKERAYAAIFSLVVVTTLALLGRSSGSVVFFYLLPGWWISLLITGGHGGNVGVETVAFLARFLVNLVVYYGVITLLLSIRKRHRHS